jgi:hypothetical protein
VPDPGSQATLLPDNLLVSGLTLLILLVTTAALGAVVGYVVVSAII